MEERKPGQPTEPWVRKSRTEGPTTQEYMGPMRFNHSKAAEQMARIYLGMDFWDSIQIEKEEE